MNGSLNFFNHRTTVDISNRLVCFDIKGLGKNLKKPGMLIVQDAVWNTVTINRAIGRSTWYFVDEFHLLLKRNRPPHTAPRFGNGSENGAVSLPGRPRTPKTCFPPRRSKTSWKTATFIYMLNQAAGDRKILRSG